MKVKRFADVGEEEKKPIEVLRDITEDKWNKRLDKCVGAVERTL